MANYPNNILQQVATYQKSSLAELLNLCCFVSTANTKFKDFDRISTNLGSSVTFDLPPRFTTSQGLVASFQVLQQRVQNLVCSQSANTSFSATAQQRIFNLEKAEWDYMKIFGNSAMAELANQIEADVQLNAISGVVNQLSGQVQNDSGPYRFFGDGVTQLSSYQQLAQMVVLFDNYGSVATGKKVYLPDVIIPSIIGSGLNQFAPERNNEDAMNWEIGRFGVPTVDYYKSNLLPIHVSGSVGNAASGGNILTVVSTNDPTGQNVTQITFSGATANDVNAIFSGDLMEFNDGVSGQLNLRYLTFIGHVPSANHVQVRALSGAAANGSGNVTVNITPSLNWAGGANQNLTSPIMAGMQVTVLPSHRAGLVVGGDALFIAMPQLPEQSPYDTANEYDKDTGVSLRLTYGSTFGANQTGMIYDSIWGSTVVPEYSMRIIVPLSQG